MAFAGHARREDLGHSAAVSDQLRAVFAELGLRDSILISGLAEGADQLAVRAWSETASGTVHAVLPYLDSALPAETPDIVTATTWLDGRAAEAAGRNAHLVQTRWVLEDADLLVVVWTGVEARGAGGTADAVRLALQRNLPVIWVKPGQQGPAHVISPTALETDFGFLEFLEQLQAANPPLVHPFSRDRLADALSVPSPPTAQPMRRTAFHPVAQAYDALLDRTLWRTFALYRGLMGGKPRKGRAAMAPPAELASEPGFRRLSEAYAEADQRATHLAAVHRSQQVFQALIMIVAVAVGAAPAIWPELKINAVLTELGLALVTFVVWASAVASQRTRRWGEARRLAEQLRLERAAWAIGVSTRGDRRSGEMGPAARIAWSYRRAAGSPTGAYDAERVRTWGGWALDALVYDQIDYHARQGELNHRLSHRGHQLEHSIFWIFVALLASYAIAHFAGPSFGFEAPHWYGSVLVLAGAITPAFGAASLALEASLGFAEHARRSERMEDELTAIAEAIPEHATLDALQRAARSAIHLHVGQEDYWSEEAAHRHVMRGG